MLAPAPPAHDPPREEVKDTFDELMRSRLLPFPVVDRLFRLSAGLAKLRRARTAQPVTVALAFGASAAPGFRAPEMSASFEGGRRQGERVAHK